MLDTVRELQVALLALILLGACAAKLSRVLRAGTVQVVLDATALFPPRLRRPAMMALCATELLLGAALLITIGRVGAGEWADGIRLTAACFFLAATSALVELRAQRPGLGCGCFGDLSSKPPGLRSVARTALFAAAALASVHSGALLLPRPGLRAVQVLAIVIAELAAIAAVSPELNEALARLGYSEPCEMRAASPQRALAALHRSRAWRSHSPFLSPDGPSDMWRELCWWYVVYPGNDSAARSDIVFAVEVRPRRPAVRAAVVSRAGDTPAQRSGNATTAASPGGLSGSF